MGRKKIRKAIKKQYIGTGSTLKRRSLPWKGRERHYKDLMEKLVNRHLHHSKTGEFKYFGWNRCDDACNILKEILGKMDATVSLEFET